MDPYAKEYAKEHAEDVAKTAKWAKETGVEL